MLDPEDRAKGWSADGVIKSRDDLDKMVFADIGEVVELCEAFLAHKGDFAACAMTFLGIDPCWHSMGFETFSESLIADPDLIGEVLGRICDWYARCMEEVCKLDFDFVWVAEDIAYHQNPFFSTKHYREILLPHTRKVAQKITKPWIYHSDGNLSPILDHILSQGMNALHALEHGSMDLQELKDKYGHRVTLVGNIDLGNLERGSEEEIEAEVREKIRILGPNYRYIVSSSNSITPNVKPRNLTAMLRALEKYGKYPLE
jgi:uroporphyrinogen decarboxylase